MLYEYRCEECNHTFERVLSFDDREIPLNELCPECGVDKSVYRVYSHGGFVDPGILKADKNMERSGVQKALERIRDHAGEKMIWKG